MLLRGVTVHRRNTPAAMPRFQIEALAGLGLAARRPLLYRQLIVTIDIFSLVLIYSLYITIDLF